MSTSARAEVPAPPERREFRVDFSAKHLDVDADLGELSLSGDVVVTVGRYRLGGDKVRLKRGPRGVGVSGGGDIAFCSCEAPPVTLGYSSVTIAPPSDVLMENAVLRAGGVPLFWLPYLWLRSPDRVGVVFPSVEWRGDDGLLIGSGIHVPFDSNQGRPASRALDIGAFGYLEGGVRVDARLLTPQSTSLVRWDFLDESALTIDAHAAASGETAAIWAFDVDASRGPRGRVSQTALEAAARRYDHGRFGAGSVGSTMVAVGVAADGQRGAWLSDPLALGPFGVVATGGELGRSSSYALDLAAGSWFGAGDQLSPDGETRALQRGSLESALPLGPVLVRAAGFEQAEVLSLPGQAASKLRAGAGLSLGLPLVRRFESATHSIAPQLLGRVERQFWDGTAATFALATAGVASALGSGPRGPAGKVWLGAGLAGDPEDPALVTEASAGVDGRLLGLRLAAVAEPEPQAAEATARLRLGARSGTTLVGYAEARTERAPAAAAAQAGGDVLPAFHELGAYDRAGLTTGAELTLDLWSVVALGGGVDVDPLEQDLLAVRSFARYRHACRCVAVGGFGSRRLGRGGFDAGLSLDLMP